MPRDPLVDLEKRLKTVESELLSCSADECALLEAQKSQLAQMVARLSSLEAKVDQLADARPVPAEFVVPAPTSGQPGVGRTLPTKVPSRDALFFCATCNGPLSLFRKVCPSCNADVDWASTFEEILEVQAGLRAP